MLARIETTVGTMIPTMTVHTSVANFGTTSVVGTDKGVSSMVIVSVVPTGITSTVSPVNHFPVSVLGTGSNVPPVPIAAG